MSKDSAQHFANLLKKIAIVDPHSHIDPLRPTAKNFVDLLGYHYYTELAHSAGLPREYIESPDLSPKERVGRLMEAMPKINNTVQWSWIIDLSIRLFGWNEATIEARNWERLYDLIERESRRPDWEEHVLATSGVESIFLTNDFDDPLEGFNTQRYIPCLRTDDLVFHFDKQVVRDRLQRCSSIDVHSLASLRDALANRFFHFVSHNARACAISLPPSFSPQRVDRLEAENALMQLLRTRGDGAVESQQTMPTPLCKWIFWTLTELCNEHHLPFDLMIGVNRRVYPGGVYQGQDLFDSRVSMIQYAELFNAFPDVCFPISVLASATNQELVDYAWIFPNVVTNGHWWYSNTPSFIHRDLRARIEAIPRTKQIGYYSDAYKMEFILPKFNMYREILAKVLLDEFAIARRWSEESCLSLGFDLLRGNSQRLFHLLANDR